MRRRSTLARIGLVTSTVFAAVLVAALAIRAVNDNVATEWPGWPDWFGAPSSWQTILLVVAALTLACVLLIRSQGGYRAGTPVAIVAGLALVGVLLGMTSYWKCHDDSENPFFFTALMWTASLVKGGIGDPSIGDAGCPETTPVALDVARLAALGVLLITVLGVVSTIFRDRIDRVRIFLARSVTAIIGMDDDAESMVKAIASDKGAYGMPVILTASPDRPCVQDARKRGVRVITVDFNRKDTWTSLSLWDKVKRLYLLSPDATTNLIRLDLIKQRIDLTPRSAGGRHRHVPLIVRIDDPWQAEAWRAQQMGTDDHWAPDAVGKYEVTARRLLDRIINNDKVSRIVVCGTSQLTLALCADMAQRRLEYEYYPADMEPPTITLVAENAAEYRDDHEYHRRQLGLPSNRLVVEAFPNKPTVPFVKSLLTDDGGGLPVTTAIVLVDSDPIAGSSVDSSTGTRLAAQLPSVPIYAWDPAAEAWDPSVQRTVEETGEELFLVGRLRTFRLTMDLPEGQAQDAWERAARLIHTRYAATAEPSESTKPWDELSAFYKKSNHRLVLNALWIVKTEGGHTWDTWGSMTETATPAGFADMQPLEKLRALGFTEEAAMKMAEKEHQSWYDYLIENGWRWGPQRLEKEKTNPRLLKWDAPEAAQKVVEPTLSSLANTLIALRRLGYRSRPAWQRFRRSGVVTARQRAEPWTWTSHSGDEMSAQAGDWEVSDGRGPAWSVNKERFAETYEHVEGDRWRRTGTALARCALAGEKIETMEGPEQAKAGDWVIKGDRGEQWPVPGADFVLNYEGPLPRH